MEEIIEGITSVLGILCVIALPIGFGMYLGLTSIRARHAENMELIKQGIIPPQTDKKQTINKYKSLRNGFLCVGIALGLISATIVSNTVRLQENEQFFVAAGCVLLFIGLAYLGFYLLIKDNKETESDIE